MTLTLTLLIGVVLGILSSAAASASPARGDDYKCTTEFGQTIPIRMIVTENGKSKTTEWNPDVEKLTTFSSGVKRRALTFANKSISLETRYATREGPTFTIKLQCTRSGCDGSLPAPKMRLDTEVFDKRPESRAGWAELQLTHRSHLNLLVRVFRESPALSGSGELKFLNKQDRYLIDVGVDEQIELVEGFKTRLAALELKVDCKKSGPKKD